MKKIYYPLLILLIFTSCETVNRTVISCLQPGEVNFPEQIKSIGIVNNLRSTFVKDSLGIYQLLSKKDINSPYYVSGAKTAESIAKSLADQKYFDEIVICDSALRTRDSIYRIKPLEKEEVSALMEGLSVDGILSLEDLKMSATKEYIPHIAENYVEGKITVVMQPIVSFYVNNRVGPVFTIYPKDSINWNEAAATQVELDNLLLPNDTKIIADACDYAGTIPTKYLIPHWTEQNRVYFSDQMSTPLKNAANAVGNNDWKMAGSIWKSIYDKKSSASSRLKMAFNLALFEEMNSKFDEALSWLQKAEEALKTRAKTSDTQKFVGKSAYYYGLINEYKKIIEGRKEKISQLNLQLERFNHENK